MLKQIQRTSDLKPEDKFSQASTTSDAREESRQVQDIFKRINLAIGSNESVIFLAKVGSKQVLGGVMQGESRHLDFGEGYTRDSRSITISLAEPDTAKVYESFTITEEKSVNKNSSFTEYTVKSPDGREISLSSDQNSTLKSLFSKSNYYHLSKEVLALMQGDIKLSDNTFSGDGKKFKGKTYSVGFGSQDYVYVYSDPEKNQLMFGSRGGVGGVSFSDFSATIDATTGRIVDYRYEKQTKELVKIKLHESEVAYKIQLLINEYRKKK